MTGLPFLDAALISVSLFNTVIMVWLGLTVLFNVSHRVQAGKTGSWGFWIAGFNLLLGSVFFIIHTIVVSLGFNFPLAYLNIMWVAAWIAVAALPFSWYAVMLWYGGYWEDPLSDIARRHRKWIWFISIYASVWMFWIVFIEPIPSLSQIFLGQLPGWPSFGGLPLTILAYPPFILLCTLLAFDALRRPGPTARLMGTLARQRARPWLAAASLVLTTVCLFVGSTMLWLLLDLEQRGFYLSQWYLVGILDVLIAGLIGVAVILLGQAIVAYEVFTGRILPRKGLAVLWRQALLLASAYSLLCGFGLAFHVTTLFLCLLATLLLMLFYAYLGRLSYAQRESFLETLRPFASSQELYDKLTHTDQPLAETDVHAPFTSLCRDFLAADQAVLTAVGSMSPLWGNPVTYPASFPFSIPSIDWTLSPRPLVISIERQADNHLAWMVPLWSNRGPIGLLLLGNKLDGSLFTQEDLEIAQAVSERLIDTHASTELARKLFLLQRERIVNTQLLDRKTRRVLHDEVLPSLHAILLSLQPGVDSTNLIKNVTELSTLHRRISDLLRDLPSAAPSRNAQDGLFPAIRHFLEEELHHPFEEIIWQVSPEAESSAMRLSPTQNDVLFYAAREAIRNSAKYGRGKNEQKSLTLSISGSWQDGLELVLEDNGIGLQIDAASEGSGQGLALHGTMMALIGGELIPESQPGEFTRIRLRLPASSIAGFPSATQNNEHSL